MEEGNASILPLDKDEQKYWTMSLPYIKFNQIILYFNRLTPNHESILRT